MKIFCHCHTYGHNKTSGADVFMQSLLEFLASKGCEVKVAIDNCPVEGYELNGVYVMTNRYLIAEHYEASDVIFIHLIFNDPALAIARRFNKPVIHVAHNGENRTSEGYVIYNSETLRNELKMPLEGVVVNPPTYVKDWQNDIDHFYQPYITLVNCCSNKGGEMLKSLATWMPQYKFLGVIGNYGNQMRQGLPNLIYRPFTEKMNYDDTRILIVPSKKESWSLCAAEAMASGIPVIGSDLPGLRENCGDTAIYCPQSVGNWKIAIELLQSEYEYKFRAAAGLQRSYLQQPKQAAQLENMYNFILNIAMRKRISSYVSQPHLKDFEDALSKQVAEEREKEELKPEKEKKEIKPKKEKKVYGAHQRNISTPD